MAHHHFTPSADSPRDADGLSRRDFLRRSALAGAAAALGASVLGSAANLLAQTAGDAPKAAPATPAAPEADRPKSRVVVITHPEVLIKDYTANVPQLQKMIERAVRELTGADSDKKAWATIAAAGDRVSMKTTRAAGDTLKTHDEIPAYLARRLAEAAGVDKTKIRAWDRPDLTPEELELSDPYTLPTRGKETRLRAALVKDNPVIINLPVLKMHSGTGASVAMKNHFGSINNPSTFHGWGTGDMAKSIAEVSNLEPIRKRTRLVIVDATRPLWDGGPNDKPECRWNFNGLVVGTDPVAVERIALDILEKKREEVRRDPWPATDARKVVEWAEHLGVGQADLKRIDLVRLDLG